VIKTVYIVKDDISVLAVSETHEIAMAYAANYARRCTHGQHNHSTTEITSKNPSTTYLTIHLWKQQEVGTFKCEIRAWNILVGDPDYVSYLDADNYIEGDNS
jgi:hypothetical protein